MTAYRPVVPSAGARPRVRVRTGPQPGSRAVSGPLEDAGDLRDTHAVPAALVAVPGLGLGQESWRPALMLLAGSAGIVEALPGYGLPVARCGARAPAQLAEYLCRHLTEPVVLLGHSASCQVVAHAAKLRPDLVERLVLVAPTPCLRATSWASLSRSWLRNAAHEDPRRMPTLLRQYHHTGLGSMVATVDAARGDDISATLAQVRCPVVLVRGREDRIVSSDWLHTLAGAGPARTVVEIPEGAHMVPLTHPAAFAEHVQPALL